jgi:hypothetical protein
MSEFEMFRETLSQPEYQHVLLNMIPIIGLAVALLGTVAAIITRNRTARNIGLSLVVLTSLSVWLVEETGEAAYRRVYATCYQDGQQWLEVHEHRAERVAIVYYLTALAALGAIVASFVYKKAALPLEIVTVLLAIAALLAGGWVAHAGGKIRHQEFRSGPPPAEWIQREAD